MKNLFKDAKVIGDEKPVIQRTVKGRFDDYDLNEFLMDSTKHEEPAEKKPRKTSKPKPQAEPVSMSLTVVLNGCKDCRHRDHSGAFTPGGARPICGHYDAVRFATYKKLVNKKDKDDKYHWRHRVLKDLNKIPEWCPLKHGMCY